MTEDEAKDWVRDLYGPTAMAHLQAFVECLLVEAERQSLIARSTFEEVWARHIVDSAQLVRLAPAEGVWLDVGAGGGLPGVVVAVLRDAPLVMVEPRKKRADFLTEVAARLPLANATVVQSNVQKVSTPAAAISARAVAPLDDIFAWTRGAVSRETLYLCPRGENADADLDIARRAWHGTFHVEQSITSTKAGIIVARGVSPR